MKILKRWRKKVDEQPSTLSDIIEKIRNDRKWPGSIEEVTAELVKETQKLVIATQGIVKKSHHLVIATWALVIVTMIIQLLGPYFIKKFGLG
jgi:hypothetical protein